MKSILRNDWTAVALSMLVSSIIVTGCQPPPPSPREIEAVHLPSENTRLVIRPAMLFSSPLKQKLVDQLASLNLAMGIDFDSETLEGKVQSNTGIDPSTISLVTVSIDILTHKTLATVKATKDIEPKTVIDAVSKASGQQFKSVAEHRGVQIYAEGIDTDGAMAFVDARTLLVGGLSEVKQGIDHCKSGDIVATPRAVSAVAGGAPTDAVFVLAASEAAFGAPETIGVDPDEARRFESALLSISADEKAHLKAKASFKTKADGELMRKLAMENLKKVKDAIGKLPAWTLSAPLREAVEGVVIGGSGKVVEVRASVGPEALGPIAPLLKEWVVSD